MGQTRSQRTQGGRRRFTKPALDRRQGREEEEEEEKSSQSLPRERTRDGSDSDGSRTRRRGRSKSRKRRSRSSEERVRVVEERINSSERELAEDTVEVDEEVEEAGEVLEEDDDVFLPVPILKLPRPKQDEEENATENDVAAHFNSSLAEQYRQLMGLERERKRIPRPESACESVRSIYEQSRFQQDQINEDVDVEEFVKMPLPAADTVSQNVLFSFLTSAGRQQGGDESDSGGASRRQPACRTLAGHRGGSEEGSRAVLRPGPWLQPSEQRVAQLTAFSRSHQHSHPHKKDF
ncbi:hypothetical protein WMY93_030980 [Mugilogobius chulae]|uniref:Uncharacterized protein n=1 Tax=Mugilogobius chulae TaxID=88201 RepID=A0AAW0MJF2_9GOBI